MTIEQRKIDVINSITNVDNESLLVRIQELVKDANSSIPPEIMTLLDEASKEGKETLTEHTSVRDILNS